MTGLLIGGAFNSSSYGGVGGTGESDLFWLFLALSAVCFCAWFFTKEDKKD